MQLLILIGDFYTPVNNNYKYLHNLECIVKGMVMLLNCQLDIQKILEFLSDEDPLLLHESSLMNITFLPKVWTQ